MSHFNHIDKHASDYLQEVCWVVPLDIILIDGEIYTYGDVAECKKSELLDIECTDGENHCSMVTFFDEQLAHDFLMVYQELG